MWVFKKLGVWIGAAAAFALALLAVIVSSKRAGRAEAEVESAKQDTRDNEAIAVRQINEAREAAAKESETLGSALNEQNKINSLNPGAAAERLRDDWSRD